MDRSKDEQAAEKALDGLMNLLDNAEPHIRLEAAREILKYVVQSR